MAKTNWNRSLAEGLKHETQTITWVSENTGNEYVTDVVPSLNVLSVGSCEEVEGGFKYSVVDTTNDLEYSIKSPNNVAVKFGTILQFKNVRGGATSSGIGWFKSDSVIVVKTNET